MYKRKEDEPKDMILWAKEEFIEMLVEALDVMGCYAILRANSKAEWIDIYKSNRRLQITAEMFSRASLNDQMSARSVWKEKQASRGRTTIAIEDTIQACEKCSKMFYFGQVEKEVSNG